VLPGRSTLGERPAPRDRLGIGLVAAGVLVLSLRR
jgi:uncharacterized membrane protein